MEKYSRMHLFQGYGIELEYMIVDCDTLEVKPIADELIRTMTGTYSEEFVNGSVTWSNELVLHVIELKCAEPTKDLVELNKNFQDNIELINNKLKLFNAKLMPTAAHPWMNPASNTFLWPHGNSEVYETYDRIFHCKGHGWSNLQSTHINLPFYDDEEFAKLHMAVRVVLPLIPALAASSPILDSAFTGVQDMRLIYYGENQIRIPSITGKIIPEKINSKRQYHKLIYDKIEKDIAPYNDKHILNPIWVNSRGAIARFDRGSLEIRIIDIQECPMADLAIASFIICVLKMLTQEVLSPYENQHHQETESLYKILQGTIKLGGEYSITNSLYLASLGINNKKMTAIEVWKLLLERSIQNHSDMIAPWRLSLETILREGILSKRILSSANNIYSTNNLKLIYQELSENLVSNQLFNKNETVPRNS